jgi:hypothetical protein
MTMPTGRPYLTNWGTVIETLGSLGADDYVCFGDGPNSSRDPCLVCDAGELADDEDTPHEARQRGWTTALDIQSIQGVISNLRQRTTHPDTELIVRAIAYYVDNDAFLEGQVDPAPSRSHR